MSHIHIHLIFYSHDLLLDTSWHTLAHCASPISHQMHHQSWQTGSAYRAWRGMPVSIRVGPMGKRGPGFSTAHALISAVPDKVEGGACASVGAEYIKATPATHALSSVSSAFATGASDNAHNARCRTPKVRASFRRLPPSP
jgi:hypothetical protein